MRNRCGVCAWPRQQKIWTFCLTSFCDVRESETNGNIDMKRDRWPHNPLLAFDLYILARNFAYSQQQGVAESKKEFEMKQIKLSIFTRATCAARSCGETLTFGKLCIAKIIRYVLWYIDENAQHANGVRTRPMLLNLGANDVDGIVADTMYVTQTTRTGDIASKRNHHSIIIIIIWWASQPAS